MDGLRRCFGPTTPLALSAGLGRVTKSVPPTGQPLVSPEAVLTYPLPDLVGDLVDPDGIDWTPFHRDYHRLTNFEHGAYIGTGEIQTKSVPGVRAGERVNVPTGTTTFFTKSADLRGMTLRRYDAAGKVCGVYTPDECLRTAEQVAPLVMDGTLGGVSIEFRPAGPEGMAWKSLGAYSPRLGRDPRHFWSVYGTGYAAACDIPVCPQAGYLTDDSPHLPRAEKAFKLLHETPGLYDPSGLIRKSLTPLAALVRTPGRTTAAARSTPMTTTRSRQRVVKAEPYEDDPTGAAPEGMGDVPPVDQPPADAPATDMKPTPAALFQLAQTVLDAADMGEQMAAAGEHTGGLKLLAKHCEAARGLAAKIKADAEKVAADVGGEPVADEPDAEPPPVEVDDETGEMKSLAFDGIDWRPRRFRRSDLGPPLKKSGKATAPAVPAGHVAVPADYLKQLELIANVAGCGG